MVHTLIPIVAFCVALALVYVVMGVGVSMILRHQRRTRTIDPEDLDRIFRPNHRRPY